MRRTISPIFHKRANAMRYEVVMLRILNRLDGGMKATSSHCANEWNEIPGFGRRERVTQANGGSQFSAHNNSVYVAFTTSLLAQPAPPNTKPSLLPRIMYEIRHSPFHALRQLFLNLPRDNARLPPILRMAPRNLRICICGCIIGLHALHQHQWKASFPRFIERGRGDSERTVFPSTPARWPGALASAIFSFFPWGASCCALLGMSASAVWDPCWVDMVFDGFCWDMGEEGAFMGYVGCWGWAFG